MTENLEVNIIMASTLREIFSEHHQMRHPRTVQ